MSKKVKKQVHKIDIGVVDRPWKFSKNPREEAFCGKIKITIVP